MTRFASAQEAVLHIQSGSTFGVGGFGGFPAPDELLRAIAERFASSGEPAGLTVVAGVCPGDLREGGDGMGILAAKGLISSIYAAHVGMPPVIGRAVSRDEIACFLVPHGVLANLLKAVAARRPGFLTRIGLHTCADPRHEGCAINASARQSGREAVRLMELGGKEYLFYPSFPIGACVIRGTRSDERGNISLERECICCEQYEMAAAVRASGGTVIAQVEEVVPAHAIDPHLVRVHESLVDFVVVSPPGEHPQCYDGNYYRPELCGAGAPVTQRNGPEPLGIRKICGRRAAMELYSGEIVVIGVGTPDSIPGVLEEEGLENEVTFVIDTGVFGGFPIRGVSMGASVNPAAIYPLADSFDFFHGGGAKVAFLGFGEIDRSGNVNASNFGSKCTGPGGFIDISQSTRRVCFVGSFQVSGAANGNGVKFVSEVSQVTFSARYAREMGQRVLYITERAVFELGDEGLVLTEIAPQLDVERDLLPAMDFRPEISPNLKNMSAGIFSAGKMSLRLKRGE